MKKILFTALITLAFTMPMASASEIKQFMGIDMNTPFIPDFYEGAHESQKEGIMYEVPMPKDSIFKSAEVIMGLKDYPYLVKGCTSESSTTQIAEVLEIKYAHYDNYQRVHYSPLESYRFGARVDKFLVRSFKESVKTEGKEPEIMNCASIQNLEMPNYEWLSKQDGNPITLFRDL